MDKSPEGGSLSGEEMFIPEKAAYSRSSDQRSLSLSPS
jgi:hypothetical protein